MRECILFAVLACCAAYDVKAHRIPNLYVGCGLVMELALVCMEPLCGWPGAGGAALMTEAVMAEVLMAAAGFAGRAVLAWMAGFPLFVLGMVGAGDIKVICLIAASLGIRDSMMAVMAGLMLGAVMALHKMLRQGSVCQRFSYLSAYIRRAIQTKKVEKYYCPGRDGYECVIPLGACLSVGALLTVLWRG